VRDKATNKVLFESGGTNSIGAIVDMQGKVLPSEYNGSAGANGHAYQPHFWSGNPLRNDQQVQIFEELLKDADGNFTTTFNGRTIQSTYVDSGSNGIFFLDSATTGLPMCRANSDFYCAPSPQPFTATNQAINGAPRSGAAAKIALQSSISPAS